MALTIRDVRIACVGVEANMAPLNRTANGPLDKIGEKTGYEALFDDARGGLGGLRLPWAADKPKASQFWKNYVTQRLQEGDEAGWPSIARNALVPLRTKVALPVLQVPYPTRRSYAEAYVWQTGFGVSWNVWIKDAALSIADLTDLVDRIWTRTFDVKAAGGGAVTQSSLTGLYRSSLDLVRSAALGAAVKEDHPSDPAMVVTIVAGDWPDDTPAERAAAREELLSGLEAVFGRRPAKLADDTRGDDETVYVTPKLRLAWNPKSALKKQGRVRKLACLHRNSVQSALQAEMLAQSTVRLSWYLDKGGVPAALGDITDRIGALSNTIVAKSGYSSPALRQQLMRPEVVAARGALRI